MMRICWMVQGSHRPTKSICRACLQRLQTQAPSDDFTSFSFASSQRRHFSNQGARLNAQYRAQSTVRAESTSTGDDGGTGERQPQRPHRQFGSFAGSRQTTTLAPEELERRQSEAARSSSSSPSQSHGQPRRYQDQWSSTSAKGNEMAKPRFTIVKHAVKDANANQIPQKPFRSRQYPSTNQGKKDSPGGFQIRKSFSNETEPTQPRQGFRFRQDSPQGSGWSTLPSKDHARNKKSEQNDLGGWASSAEQPRRTAVADDAYYKDAAQREARTRNGGFVGLNPNSDPWQPSREDVARSVPRRPVRFERGDAQQDDFERDQRRRQRSFDSAPKRRGYTGRRAEKFEDADAGDLLAYMNTARISDKKKKKRERNVDAPTPIELSPFMSVQSLAIALKQRPEDLVVKLEELGFEDVAMDHVLDAENAGLVAMEYNFEPIIDRSEEEDLFAAPVPEDTSSLPQRPPVITIMGHVDHGKTTILDYLRKSAIAASEHGGITQHIGAFVVPMASGKLVTFLDTPGHAAFLSMRERGANVTDIVILVVAADDSVKPQTVEAIKHAKAAQVPIIVAINKVDKDQADVMKVKQDLMVHDIEVEDFGGDYQAIEVSGKTGQGMDNLEEAMITQAELLDTRVPMDGPTEGWVIEATTKKSGRTATVLVRRGTMRVGDVIVAGKTWARVRTLRNEAGLDVPEAGPGTPVEVDGWRDQPAAGDEVLEAATEQRATSVVRFREERAERSQAAVDMQAINDTRRQEAEKRAAAKAAEEAAKAAEKAGQDASTVAAAAAAAAAPAKAQHTDLYAIVKADVSGSAEAVTAALAALPLANQPVALHVLRSGVGPLAESDVAQLQAVPAGEALLVSFNQPVPAHVARDAERAGLPLVDASIIYQVVDGVRALVEAHLPPVVTSRVIGDAEIAQAFEIRVGGSGGSGAGGGKKMQRVAGCRVRNGSVQRGMRVRVFRGEMGPAGLVHEGSLSTLRNQKRDVTEMKKGSECGLSFEGWEGFEVGDIVQCYEEKSERRRLPS